jgi:gluconolactonase
VAAIAGTAGCATAPTAPLLPPRPSYEGLSSDDYLDELTILRELSGDNVFTEGPSTGPDGSVYFTSRFDDAIMRWNPVRGVLDTFRENSNLANGLFFDRDGRLLICEGGANRLTRLDIETGALEVLADSFEGLPIDPPNDLCLDSAGRIYFSSRPSTGAPSLGNAIGVYRLDPDGNLTRLLTWPEVHMPNGVAISPDGSTFYLIETHRDLNHHRDIRAYDLSGEGTLSNERVIVNFYPGRSGDGMAVDEQGNLYVAAGMHALRGSTETLDTLPGIHVFSPQGQLLAYRRTPEDTVTNCCFGGDDRRTLYVTAGRHLLAARTVNSGAAA